MNAATGGRSGVRRLWNRARIPVAYLIEGAVILASLGLLFGWWRP